MPNGERCAAETTYAEVWAVLQDAGHHAGRAGDNHAELNSQEGVPVRVLPNHGNGEMMASVLVDAGYGHLKKWRWK
jgi:hypothetical protein